MATVNIHEEEVQFSGLVDRAAKGETVIIARAGKPVAKIVPLPQVAVGPSKSRLGFLDGQISVPDDFDRMMEEEIDEMFNGKP